MIVRIWHGWTTPENADAYEKLLENEIFVNIRGLNIAGFHGIRLLRRAVSNEVEFITIMEFDSVDDIREFSGDDHEKAVIPERARAVLKRFDERSQHYELIISE